MKKPLTPPTSPPPPPSLALAIEMIDVKMIRSSELLPVGLCEHNFESADDYRYHPVVVREISHLGKKGPDFELMCGSLERAVELGLQSVPAVNMGELDPDRTFALAIRLHTEDFVPLSYLRIGGVIDDWIRKRGISQREATRLLHDAGMKKGSPTYVNYALNLVRYAEKHPDLFILLNEVSCHHWEDIDRGFRGEDKEQTITRFLHDLQVNWQKGRLDSDGPFGSLAVKIRQYKGEKEVQRVLWGKPKKVSYRYPPFKFSMVGDNLQVPIDWYLLEKRPVVIEAPIRDWQRLASSSEDDAKRILSRLFSRYGVTPSEQFPIASLTEGVADFLEKEHWSVRAGETVTEKYGLEGLSDKEASIQETVFSLEGLG